MKIITEFNKFNQKSIIDKLSDGLSGIFKNVKVKNNTILASSLLDKSGNPIVRIDSKEPIKAVMLKIGKDSVMIKSIVNSTHDNKGLATKVIKIILNSIDKKSTIIIDQDVSGGFWDKIINQYPDYNWTKS
jgi:hypothetical protein